MRTSRRTVSDSSRIYEDEEEVRNRLRKEKREKETNSAGFA
jgi:hypothetical protein